MKKLFFLFTLFISTITFAQYPNAKQTLGNDSNVVQPKGALQARVINFVYYDTTLANLEHIKEYPGSQIFTTSDNSFWLRNNLADLWLLTGKIDTTLVDWRLFVYYDSTGHRHLAIATDDGLEAGTGIITWRIGLTYDISPSILHYQNRVYFFPATSLTLDSADTDPRYDVFAIDTSGVFILKGTPSATPTIPQPDIGQFAMTSGFLLNPGQTEPNLYIETIYDENLGAPDEWTYTSTGTITKDANSTLNPYHLTKSIYVSSYNNGSRHNFLNASTDTLADGKILIGWIYLNKALDATHHPAVRFFTGTIAATNTININNNYGINNNLVNEWQRFAIPVSAFTKTTQTFNTLRITNIGTDNTDGYFLDYIQLQSGVGNIPPPTDYSQKQDSNTLVKTTVGSDTLNVINYWKNGLATSLPPIYTHSGGTGGGGIHSVTGTLGVRNINDSTVASDTAYLKTVFYNKNSVDSGLATRLLISDTTGKWVQTAALSTAGDSLVVTKNTIRTATKITAAGGSGIKAYAPLIINAAGDSISQRFNVLTYGAIPNDTLDDAAAIQAAINAAYSAGGGTVFFPNGKYYIKNALVNSGGTGIGSPNSQLYFKGETSPFNVTGSVSIKLLGETPPGFFGSALINYKVNPSGVILYSNITGSGTYPSIIGADGISWAYGSINSTHVSIENINFRVKANIAASGPTMSAVNFKKLSSCSINNVVCDIDTSSNLAAYPTAETFGIYMPTLNNSVFLNIKNTLVTGYKYGYILGEHTTGDNLSAFVCEYAYVFNSGIHAMQFGRIDAQWCKYSISGPVGTITALGSSPYITIQEFNTEYQISLGDWFDQRYFVYDSTNLLNGNINYFPVQRGIGFNSAGFTKLGGTNLKAQLVGYEYDPTVNGNIINTTAGSTARTLYTNDAGERAAVGIGGSAFGNGFNNNAYLFGKNSVIINADSENSGGTGKSSISFRTGGYTTSQERGRFFSNGTFAVNQTTDSLSAKVVVNGNSYTYGSQAGGNNVWQKVKNTAANGDARMSVYNSGNAGAYFQVTGSSYALPSVASVSTEGTLTSFDFITNADVTSGGNTYIRFLTGGYTSGQERMRISASGNVGIGVTTITALLHLKAGTATASTAPLKFTTTSAVILATPETGAIETDSTTLYYSSGIGLNLKRNRIATWGYTGVTSTYTILSNDKTVDCTGGGTFTVTLPTAVGNAGKIFYVTNSGTGTITVGTTSSQTFANVTATPTTLTMVSYGAIQVQSNGANWLQLK